LLFIRIHVRDAQAQFGGADQLAVIRRLFDACYIHASHKISALRDKTQGDAVSAALRVHCYIRIAARGIKALNGLTQIVFMEGGALGERKTPAQFFLWQRLIGRFERDASDRMSFVLECFFEKRSVFSPSGSLPRLRLAESRERPGEQNQERGC
jgi:hypothetical protein